MERLMQHQTNLLCHLLGSPVEYEGRDMVQAHKHLKVTQADFGEVATILKETSKMLGLKRQM